jgi:hypothetical protein
MSLMPEYGDEARMRQESETLQERSEGVLPEDRDEAPEREIAEEAREDAEADLLDPEANEAHAPGQVCARCGQVIIVGQDVRLRADGQWMHEVCPPKLDDVPAQ